MHTRLALAGALLIAVGSQCLLLGLLVGSARAALAQPVLPGNMGEPPPVRESVPAVAPAGR